MQPLVLDTNIVLDLLVFDDAAVKPLRERVAQPAHGWVATLSMRDEFERVLGYPRIAAWLAFHGLAAQGVLAAFDAKAVIVPVPAKAMVTCRDPDDQKFIDLAVQHRAVLLSKDSAVLTLRKRLAALGVTAASAWPV